MRFCVKVCLCISFDFLVCFCEQDMAGFEGERCGICMDIIVDRGLLDCCQHW